MLKRDFIMVQIEELGKAIAQIITNRNTNAADGNPALLTSAFHTLKIEPDELLSHSPEEICRLLDGDDGCGLKRMELAAKLLVEETYVVTPGMEGVFRAKAKELLQYVQANDHTFSIERMQLLASL